MTLPLTARVEALAGGDREVDGWLSVELKQRNIGDSVQPPRYTASLDAALDLVERTLRPLHPGMTVTVRGVYSGPERDPYWSAEITWPSSERQGTGCSAPLALLAALLRSLEADAPEPGANPTKTEGAGG